MNLRISPKKIAAIAGLLVLAAGVITSVTWLIRSDGAKRAQKLYLQQLAKTGPVNALQTSTTTNSSLPENQESLQRSTESDSESEKNNPRAGVVNAPPPGMNKTIDAGKDSAPATFKASSSASATISEEVDAPEQRLPVPIEAIHPSRPGVDASNDSSFPALAKKYPSERFLFRNLAKSALEGKAWEGGDHGPNINIGTFTPQGTEIELVVLNNLASNNLELEVIAGVWFPMYWNGRLLLRPGDRILGKATAGKNRDRILVNFYKVVFKDGKTLPIQSAALHTDGTMGIRGYKVGNVILENIGPILSDFAGAAMAAYTQRSQSTLTIGDISVQSDQADSSFRNAALQGGQRAFQRLTQLLLEEAEENRPYIFVPAGTRCRAYLEAYMDVSMADYGK